MSDKKINIHNKSGQKIDVAINRWGTGGNTDFCTINNNESDNWNRSNNMGFVMVITPHGVGREDGTYWYVQADKDLYVESLSNVVGALTQLPNPIRD